MRTITNSMNHFSFTYCALNHGRSCTLTYAQTHPFTSSLSRTDKRAIQSLISSFAFTEPETILTDHPVRDDHQQERGHQEDGQLEKTNGTWKTSTSTLDRQRGNTLFCHAIASLLSQRSLDKMTNSRAVLIARLRIGWTSKLGKESKF